MVERMKHVSSLRPSAPKHNKGMKLDKMLLKIDLRKLNSKIGWALSEMGSLSAPIELTAMRLARQKKTLTMAKQDALA